MEKNWETLKRLFQEKLSPPAYQTFLSSAQPKSLDNNCLIIEVPNEFSLKWLKEKCGPIFNQYQQNYFDMPLLLQYEINKESKNNEVEQLSFLEPTYQKPKPKIEDTSINPKYSFDNFIVGHNNRFAHAASIAVSKAPAQAYNPLFIYGSVGLGKTHLLHAVSLALLKNNPKTKIKMVSSEKFTNDLINSIKDKQVEKFRNKYRGLDVLIVDDIQFLAGKEQTQVEFFHTFNDLYNNSKQIILTSDRPPKEIQTLELRLKTRFEWGLSADIQPPEFETRIAILRKKIEVNNFHVSDEILHFIATQIPTNVREMEGALNKVVAYASLLKTEVTLSIASNVIKDLVVAKDAAPISISLIKKKTAEYFNISEEDLISKSRTKDIAYARQIAMYLCRELTNISLPKIGESFGRDHTTIMHGWDKIKSLITKDTETKNITSALISLIKNN